MKDLSNKNKLVVEETGAAVVRRIFEMCRNGMGSKKIAKVLNKTVSSNNGGWKRSLSIGKNSPYIEQFLNVLDEKTNGKYRLLESITEIFKEDNGSGMSRRD